MLNIKDTITLNNDDEYVVVSKASYNNKIYYYLIEHNNISNVLLCYENGEELSKLTDKELIKKIMPLFIKATTIDLNNNK